MTWNYRLFKLDKHPDQPAADDTYFVGECYYDKLTKEPFMHSSLDHNIVCGNDPKETAEVYKTIGEAFKSPVIELTHEGDFK